MPSQDHFRFLDLPAELRVHVYKAVFAGNVIRKDRRRNFDSTPRPTLDWWQTNAEILAVCKPIREEALPHFNVHLIVQGQYHLSPWKWHLSPTTSSAVSQLTISYGLVPWLKREMVRFPHLKTMVVTSDNTGVCDLLQHLTVGPMMEDDQGVAWKRQIQSIRTGECDERITKYLRVFLVGMAEEDFTIILNSYVRIGAEVYLIAQGSLGGKHEDLPHDPNEADVDNFYLGALFEYSTNQALARHWACDSRPHQIECLTPRNCRLCELEDVTTTPSPYSWILQARDATADIEQPA